MSIVMNTAQLARAKEARDFWRGKGTPDLQVFALIACEGGETAFIWHVDSDNHEYTPPGDNGQARGPFQWWPIRGGIIKAKCGKDVRFGPHLEALEGAYQEMTAPWSAYRHVWPALMATKTAWAAQTELVKFYEQSRNEAADVVKRVAIDAYLQHTIGRAS